MLTANHEDLMLLRLAWFLAAYTKVWSCHEDPAAMHRLDSRVMLGLTCAADHAAPLA